MNDLKLYLGSIACLDPYQGIIQLGLLILKAVLIQKMVKHTHLLDT